MITPHRRAMRSPLPPIANAFAGSLALPTHALRRKRSSCSPGFRVRAKSRRHLDTRSSPSAGMYFLLQPRIRVDIVGLDHVVSRGTRIIRAGCFIDGNGHRDRLAPANQAGRVPDMLRSDVVESPPFVVGSPAAPVTNRLK